MAPNLPTLWRNCLLQFQTEIARKAWIWYAETRGSGMQGPADTYAREVDHLVIILRPWLAHGGDQHDAGAETIDDLLRFVLLRHANWRVGGNAHPPFLTPTPENSHGRTR